MELTIVTACPGGRTTAWLAAQRLGRAAERRGWKVVFDDADHKTSDLILVAASAPVDLSPYAGHVLYRVDIADALADPDAVLDVARDRAAPYDAGDEPPRAERPRAEPPPAEPPRAEPPRAEPPRAEPPPAEPPPVEPPPVEPPPAEPPAVEPPTKPGAEPGRRQASIVAVTACSKDAAYTAMVVEELIGEALSEGHDILVEVRRPTGVEDALQADEIAVADIVLLACDVEIDESRFAGKRIYRTSTGAALTKPQATIDAALNEAVIQTANKRAGRKGFRSRRGRNR